VQRLVEIADEVDQYPDVLCFVQSIQLTRLQLLNNPLKRLNNIPVGIFRTLIVSFSLLNGDPMPVCHIVERAV
jgi:hypothetical protein